MIHQFIHKRTSFTVDTFFLQPIHESGEKGDPMKLKNLTLVITAIVLAIPSLVQAQTVNATILPTLTANLTIGDAGKIKATITQNVTQPPPSINFSYLSFNSQPFLLTTANATGATTVWRGKISISSSGAISGNAQVDSFTNTGNKTTTSLTINSTTSKISSSTGNSTINRSNLRSESWGSYQDWNDYNVIAEYPVNVVINFGSGWVARGTIIQTFQYTHNISQAAEDDDYWDDEWTDYTLVITGPNGQIGTYNR
jgi:hypothetical protein